MATETVSVIIPAYRAAGTVGRAIESVLAQTEPVAEIIVVDDGSPDDIAGAVARFGSAVTLVRQANGGVSRARNAGIEKSSGDIIALLDADDLWGPAAVARRMEAFRADAKTGVVGCKWFERRPDGEQWLGGVEHEDLFGRPVPAARETAFAVGMSMFTSTVMVRRAALGGRRFEAALPVAEDRDLWFQLAANCQTHLLNEALVTAVLEPDSLSRSDIDRDYSCMLQVVRKHADLLGPRGLREQEAIVLRRWTARHLHEGKPRSARGPAWKRIKLQPFSAQAWWAACKASILSCAG